MFGREAAKLLNYKECFPNGFKKGTKMESECSEAGLEGFPTWVINGKVGMCACVSHEIATKDLFFFFSSLTKADFLSAGYEWYF